jgi:hypothetical protein
MGYFDGLTDGLFKSDHEGKTLFYPWGVLGKGFILPNSDKKQEIRRFVKLYYVVSLPLVLLTGITVGWLYSFALVPPLILWYWLRVNRLLASVSTTTEKLKIGEAYRSSARSHNLSTLWFLEVASLLFVVSGIFILFISPHNWFAGLMSVIFFGACALAIGYMINAKKMGQ